MRVITLSNIVKFIEDKHGKQSVDRIFIPDETVDSGIIVIHDSGTVCPTAYTDSNDELKFNNNHNRVHCILLEEDLEGFNDEHPFIKSREALSGALVIDGETPSEAELWDYFFILEW